jgi:sporulation protein YlmC with PRC-barrel domain
MNIKSIIGKNVIDKRAEKIGKIEDMDLNTKT